ncbi:hypothetical protein EDC01DRAFT_791227 [Geopyxis carbonaria]|nr:hypothetical protein EDC01DRAFT_791227 [Geopyxis carbonaria]
MVVTHKSTIPFSTHSFTPGVTRTWTLSSSPPHTAVLTTVPLYSASNLPPPPQTKGSAGGKLLLQIHYLDLSEARAALHPGLVSRVLHSTLHTATPCEPGDALPAVGVASVVESFEDGWSKGDLVVGPLGVREWVLFDVRKATRGLEKLEDGVETWVDGRRVAEVGFEGLGGTGGVLGDEEVGVVRIVWEQEERGEDEGEEV